MLDPPVQTFMGWLRKDDLQLKVTASLAIGNFACSDEHTEQLVDEVDAAENLVGLLRSQVSGLEERHDLIGAYTVIQVQYRASHVLEDLGWVDLDLGCSTILLGQ